MSYLKAGTVLLIPDLPQGSRAPGPSRAVQDQTLTTAPTLADRQPRPRHGSTCFPRINSRRRRDFKGRTARGGKLDGQCFGNNRGEVLWWWARRAETPRPGAEGRPVDPALRQTLPKAPRARWEPILRL